MKKQVYNPYLPLNNCIPDGEPHVFGDRVYLFGSHDKEGGAEFCMLDYEGFSAPIDDLTDWRSEGIIYRTEQDPNYGEKDKYMYAPDVVQGNDGRYYLYYSTAGGHFTGAMHVAVCDTPAGTYEYYGEVHNKDGSVYRENITFDPGVFNDDGQIRLYYGWSLAVDPAKAKAMAMQKKADPSSLTEEQKQAKAAMDEQLIQVQMMMFEKTREEVTDAPISIMGGNVVELEDDMLTVKAPAKRIVPGQFDADGTSFEGHAFFEASSMRKINGTYYFIYSSELSHELCYATSQYPDRDFVYGGILVSNGDIGLQGRKAEDRLAATGNNHGSVEYINGKWYVFYHRQTHGNSFSRQGCAEEITLREDGTFEQVEMTSCGLNGGPLVAEGIYQAPICCNLTNGHMPHIEPRMEKSVFPYITNDGEERFITAIADNTMIGYKYFAFENPVKLILSVCGTGEGIYEVTGKNQQKLCEIKVNPSDHWTTVSGVIDTTGVQPLYLTYHGEGNTDLLTLCFEA